MYKTSVMRVLSRCFAQQTYYFFDVFIAVAVAVAKAQCHAYFSTKLRPGGPKKFLLETAPPLSKGLDDRSSLISRLDPALRHA